MRRMTNVEYDWARLGGHKSALFPAYASPFLQIIPSSSFLLSFCVKTSLLDS